MSRLVCVGLGYSAAALAERLAARGWRVAGTSRTSEGCARLAAAGRAGLLFDGSRPSPELGQELRAATHLLLSAPPGADGDPLLARHAGDLAAAPDLGWIGYLSTVGVYGDHGGGWVDESTPPASRQERALRRIAAEQAWLAQGRAGRRVQVFRLAGIYGPGRSALESVLSGEARRVVKPGQVFNRIHVADIATALEAGLAPAGPGGVFNVTDDEPAPPEDVIAFAAGLLGRPLPPLVPFEAAGLSPMAASFYADNRRVANHRLREVLGVRLAFPTYREGLRSLAAALPAAVRPEGRAP